MKSKWISLTLVSVLAFSLVLSGCSKPEKDQIPEAVETPVSSDDAGSFPIVIEHAFGETVINEKPERIAAISWGNQDVPLALGLIPVGVSEANYGVIDGSGLLPWTLDKFEELGEPEPVLFDDVAGIDYEGINDAKPDVILAAYSGITQEEYELLSEIAPVIAYPDQPWQTYWRDQILMDAKGIGMEAEGKELVGELEELILEKKEQYPDVAGKSAAFFYFSPQDLSKFYIYLPSDPRVAYLEDLGMIMPESVEKLALENESFAIELSAENVDMIQDMDIMITYGNGELMDILKNDPLIGTIPAVIRGSVAVIEDGTPLAASGTPSALSIPHTIDEYLKIIDAAASKVDEE